MYSNPYIAKFGDYLADQAETDRLEAERLANVLRLITYNNRRVLNGLRPVEIPAKLAYPGEWLKPGNRDHINLATR